MTTYLPGSSLPIHVCSSIAVYATWFGLTRRMHNKKILEWWETINVLNPLKSEQVWVAGAFIANRGKASRGNG